MNYAINIAEDGRILSATYPRYVQDAVVVVQDAVHYLHFAHH